MKYHAGFLKSSKIIIDSEYLIWFTWLSGRFTSHRPVVNHGQPQFRTSFIPTEILSIDVNYSFRSLVKLGYTLMNWNSVVQFSNLWIHFPLYRVNILLCCPSEWLRYNLLENHNFNQCRKHKECPFAKILNDKPSKRIENIDFWPVLNLNISRSKITFEGQWRQFFSFS